MELRFVTLAPAIWRQSSAGYLVAC